MAAVQETHPQIIELESLQKTASIVSFTPEEATGFTAVFNPPYSIKDQITQNNLGSDLYIKGMYSFALMLGQAAKARTYVVGERQLPAKGTKDAITEGYWYNLFQQEILDDKNMLGSHVGQKVFAYITEQNKNVLAHIGQDTSANITSFHQGASDSLENYLRGRQGAIDQDEGTKGDIFSRTFPPDNQ